MNERIQELINQATDDILGVKVLDKRMFAELIVKECARIAETAEPYQSSDLIKKHFGVGVDA
jgi:hypothetical protein